MMPMNIDSVAQSVLRTYPVKRAALFGSAARGNMTEQSDIDMLVEFLPDTRGIVFFGLQTDLEDAFGRRVDLLTYDALYREAKPLFRNAVLHDAKVIYEQQD